VRTASACWNPASYQLLPIEAPDVDAAELKAAVRWRIKEFIDFHIDDAAIDVFEMPSQGPRARARTMYVGAARNPLIVQRRQNCCKVPASMSRPSTSPSWRCATSRNYCRGMRARARPCCS